MGETWIILSRIGEMIKGNKVCAASTVAENMGDTRAVDNIRTPQSMVTSACRLETRCWNLQVSDSYQDLEAKR